MSDVQNTAILQANLTFYESFETMNFPKMQALWVKSEEAFCVHPGWEMLHGWSEVCESWRMIFQSTDFMRFKLADVVAHSRGDVGWVTCVENIYTVAGQQVFHSSVVAFNLFVFEQGEWMLMGHQGSALSNHSVDDVQDDHH